MEKLRAKFSLYNFSIHCLVLVLLFVCLWQWTIIQSEARKKRKALDEWELIVEDVFEAFEEPNSVSFDEFDDILDALNPLFEELAS